MEKYKSNIQENKDQGKIIRLEKESNPAQEFAGKFKNVFKEATAGIDDIDKYCNENFENSNAAVHRYGSYGGVYEIENLSKYKRIDDKELENLAAAGYGNDRKYEYGNAYAGDRAFFERGRAYFSKDGDLISYCGSYGYKDSMSGESFHTIDLPPSALLSKRITSTNEGVFLKLSDEEVKSISEQLPPSVSSLSKTSVEKVFYLENKSIQKDFGKKNFEVEKNFPDELSNNYLKVLGHLDNENNVDSNKDIKVDFGNKLLEFLEENKEDLLENCENNERLSYNLSLENLGYYPSLSFCKHIFNILKENGVSFKMDKKEAWGGWQPQVFIKENELEFIGSSDIYADNSEDASPLSIYHLKSAKDKTKSIEIVGEVYFSKSPNGEKRRLEIEKIGSAL